ncbi:hypothetical protein [Streptomyces sp. G45]|uniref:hypothetical protein n=1 Tax=Streptomyces sp. G45 TaxID=3406627 RepID=UPI003C1B7095
MAFGAQELRVLRRALAQALHPSAVRDLDDQTVQECVRLADDIDEVAREGARLRAFLVADLARYRAALPGTVTGYLALLDDVLATGYRPTPDDLAALRALRGNPRAAALLDRCRRLAEQDVRTRLAAATAVPPSRTRLLALPGGLAAHQAAAKDPKKPAPATPAPPRERPRPVPTPAEVFPPKRPAPPAAPPAPPTAPPSSPSRRLAAG